MRSALIILLCVLPLPALALVNINTASLSELDGLPGVGPTIAQKIIDARPFSSTSQIQNVQGIGGPGTKTYDDIIALITVEGSTSETTSDDSDDTTTESKSTDTETTKSDDTQTRYPVDGLVVTAPEHGFSGQLIEFSVEPEDDGKDRLVRYEWNFGDGQTTSGKSVQHGYKFPGTYLVVVESYYLKETKVSEIELTISKPDILLRTNGLGIQLTNESKYSMNLSGMILKDSKWQFIFPKHSWLMAGQTIEIDREADGGLVSIYSQNGNFVTSSSVADNKATQVSQATPRISAVSTSKQKVIDQSPEVLESSSEKVGVNKIQEANTAAVTNAAPDKKVWPYLGLLAVITAGLFAIWNKHKALA